MPDTHLQFGWEIRRFGTVVLDESCADYPTMQDARSADEAALSARSVVA